MLAQKRRNLLQYGVAAITGLAFVAAYGNPSGGQVVSGAIGMTAIGNTLQVDQASNLGIINWQSFSINGGEITRFNLPGTASAILNRVVTDTPSAIYGALSSNGRVFLINPSGIVVGPSGMVNVNNLVLSTKDISNASFLAGGDLSFAGDSGAAVKNLGQITASGGDAC